MALGRVRPPTGPPDPDATQPVQPRAAGEEPEPRPDVWGRPVVRAGVIAWAIVGVLVIVAAAGLLLARLSVVIVPLTVALFPAAVLVPPTAALRRRGLAPGLAA